MSRDRVGYRRPPREHRFKPGQSGNPYGRPRKKIESSKAGLEDDGFDATLRRMFDQRMQVKTANGVQQMSRVEGLINALHKSALGGSVFAQREALMMAQALEAREEDKREAEAELDRRVFERICTLKRERTVVWREALARGKEPDQPWPHPDDVLVDRNTGKWSIRGPMNPMHVLEFEHYRAERDWHIAALVHLDPKAANTAGYKLNHIIYSFAWPVFDAFLPLRGQLDGAAFKRRYFNPAILTDEQRQKELDHLDGLRNRYRRLQTPEEEREVEREVTRMMRPLLRQIGVRSVKELERLEG